MLSFEEYQEMGKKRREEEQRLFETRKKIREEELRKMGVNLNVKNDVNTKYDHPCMPDDSFVTILYAIGMIGSLIFKQWYIAWFGLTIAYFKFITRHNND